MPYGMKVVVCEDCGHSYSYIDQEIDYDQFYQEGKYVLLDTRGSLFDRIITRNNRLIIKQLGKLLPGGKVLDFGCGKGQFLALFQENWSKVGVETAEARATFAREKYGLKIATALYEQGPIEGGAYDLITLFHVVEHLPEPKHLLKELIDSNLKSGGVFVAEVPLLDSWQSCLAGKHWMHLDPPIHLSHYTRKVLLDLVEDLGLKTVRVSTLSLPLGILGMCQALMSRFGYRGKIIEDLKFKRTTKLMLGVLLALPLASAMEGLSLLFGKGGVVRVYATKP